MAGRQRPVKAVGKSENGREYYRYDGKPLAVLPRSEGEHPSSEFLRWHNEKRYVG